MSQRYFLTAEATYEELRQSLNTALAYPNALGKSVFQTALYAPRDNFRRVLLAVDTDLSGYSTIAAAIAPLLDSDAMEEIDEATYLAAVASATSGGSASHTHSAADIVSGTLNASRLPTSVVRTNTASAGPIQVYAVTAFPSPPPADPNDYMLFEGYDGVDMTSNISASGVIACAAITLAGTDLASTLAGKAEAVDVRHDISSSTTYTGRAAAGSATSASVWKIRKTVYTSAGAVSSTATATNVKWTDRLTASYS